MSLYHRYGNDLIVESSFAPKDFYNNIITEAYPDVNVGSKLINAIVNCRSGEQFTFNKILSLSSKAFIEENKDKLEQTKFRLPLYVFKFSFSNPKEIVYIFRTFSIPFTQQSGSYSERALFEQQLFKDQLSGTEGIMSFDKSFALMLLNTDNFNGNTISHELAHYFQYVLSTNEKDNLPLTYNEQMQKLMNKKEFTIIAKTDFFHQMTALYHKFYFKSTVNDFIKLLVDSLKDNKLEHTKLFHNYLKLYQNDSGPLLFFSYLYHEHHDLFLEWKQYLNKLK